MVMDFLRVKNSSKNFTYLLYIYHGYYTEETNELSQNVPVKKYDKI